MEHDIEHFIGRWKASGAAERANYALFLSELCDLLDVPRPEPKQPDDAANAYVFEKDVTFQHADGTTSIGRIDLYRRGCFVLEAKQGVDAPEPQALPLVKRPAKSKAGHGQRGTVRWDHTMVAARAQAEQYARALPTTEGWPPFLIVVDVGHCMELYADFSLQGKSYLQYPNAQGFRILLDSLTSEGTRALLSTVWTDPASLDPSRRAARVTREVAEHMAVLARSLEAQGQDAETVAGFLMRCLFTMFAEDVKLIPKDSFTDMLVKLRGNAGQSVVMLGMLWQNMDKGGFSPLLATNVLRFNGSLFANPEALPLTEQQLELLIEAAKFDWQDVEPAIFGTLLERALNPKDRHKLGAHYTPRAYVERLVMPTIVEPLREDWANVKAAGVALASQDDFDGACREVEAFHGRLCKTKVLDPACGTGNFLYVSMEHMKRLEGEVLDTLKDLGRHSSLFQAAEVKGYSVTPEQFLGIEVNPLAAAVARVVLWIGYLQWHFRTRGRTMPPEPVLKTGDNIQCRDALLAWDGDPELVLDDQGKPVTRWDGESTKPHSVTGEPVPDESKRVPVYRYRNPHKAEWAAADYVVGNPPFVGNWRMRGALGEGYAETLRATYPEVPESVDYVMYWWSNAAELVRTGTARRFGLITTNSLPQKFCRRVLEHHMNGDPPLSLLFAVPDHPWVDAADGAAVRISMTVGEAGARPGRLCVVARETETVGDAVKVEFFERIGRIHADLKIGADVASTVPLLANDRLSSRGMSLHGAGFIVTPEESFSLGLGRIPGLEKHIRHYRNGKDIMATPRGVMVIDLDGLSAEDVRLRYPEVYQWVAERVKPERDQNNEPYRRQFWWLFGRKNTDLRSFLRGLPRYISTVETSKHRVFVFLGADILPDNKLVNIGLAHALHLGVLSSRLHVTWALAAGARLEDRPVYVKSTCFDSFPFPACTDSQQARIRELGEALDAHRKRQQALHPDLTLTGMYNVLAKLRSGEPLTAKERTIHEQGLCSVLKQIHDDLDAAVFEAYGWPATLTDEEILERLVALNHERAEEEKRGLVRWLRPDHQNPAGKAAGLEQPAAKRGELFETEESDEAEAVPAATPVAVAQGRKLPWPDSVPEQVQAVRSMLASMPAPVTAEAVAKRFQRARKDRVRELLDTLVLLGQARKVGDGYGA